MGLYIVDLCRRDENHGFRRWVQIPFEFTQFRNEIKTKNGKFQLLCTNIFHRHVSKSYNSQEWSSFLVIYVRMYVFIWWCASWTDLKWNLILPGVTWAIKASYEELMYRCGTLMGTSSTWDSNLKPDGDTQFRSHLAASTAVNNSEFLNASTDFLQGPETSLLIHLAWLINFIDEWSCI